MKKLLFALAVMCSSVLFAQNAADRPIFSAPGGKVILSPLNSSGVPVPLVSADPVTALVTVNSGIVAPTCDLGTTNTIVLDGIKPLCKVIITGAATLTYSALSSGSQVTLVVINNNAGADYTIDTFTPTAKWRFGTVYNTVYRSTHNVYTIMNVGGTYYIAAMDQMQ